LFCFWDKVWLGWSHAPVILLPQPLEYLGPQICAFVPSIRLAFSFSCSKIALKIYS
jgi:hypothetical protein